MRQGGEQFGDAFIDRGMVEFVETVVAEKIFQSPLQQRFVVGVSEGAPHQRRSAISDIARHHVAIQFGAADMTQHCVHGMNQIEAGVDQSAVEIEYQQANAMWIELAEEVNHP